MKARDRLEEALLLRGYADRLREIGKREPNLQLEIERMGRDIEREAAEIEAARD